MFQSLWRALERLVEKVPKSILLWLGHFFVIMGVIGLFVWLWPTVPFLLVALWCYGKSSEKLRQKLLTHHRFGPLLKDWSERGVIRRKAKIFAILSIALSFFFATLLVSNMIILFLLAILFTGVTAFILTRPSQ